MNNDDELPPSAATNSSDLFDSEDSFLVALADAVLPGDILDGPSTVNETSKHHADTGPDFVEGTPPSTQIPRKRRLSTSPELEDTSHEPRHVPKKLTSSDGTSYMDNNTYGASHFGDFGEYMSRKRAKLQLQNIELDDKDTTSAELRRRQIFKGLAIYVRIRARIESFTVC